MGCVGCDVWWDVELGACEVRGVVCGVALGVS